MVGLLVAGQDPEGGVLPASLLNLAGAGQPDAVGIQEQHHNHSGLIGLFAPRILLAVDGVDRLEIQLSGQIQQEKHQAILWKPIHR